MQTQRLLNALAKAGATIKTQVRKDYQTGKNFAGSIVAIGPKGNVITFHEQDGFAVCVYAPSKHDDTMTDLWCGTWIKSIKYAVEVIGRAE